MLYQIFFTLIVLILAVGYGMILFPLILVAVGPVTLLLVYILVTFKKVIQLFKNNQFHKFMTEAHSLLNLK